ncbi:putative zinc finger protein [Nemania sp. FL0031]|nr:putative zinc finger protein [Nemania sp. FL0031]
MANHTTKPLLEKTLQKFKDGLRRREIETFEATTLTGLETSIQNIQAKQHVQRSIQGLHRLERFIEAIKQYGQVIDRIYGSNHFIAFIWGPLIFLLQTTSVANDAFDELLDAYERMGEGLPLLIQHQRLFHDMPHMTQILSHIYEDIISFQLIIWRYFQQPRWQQVFGESWDTIKTHFDGIIINIARHQRLIESQATTEGIEKAQEIVQRSRRNEDDQLDEQGLRRLRDVHYWLRATNADNDQDAHSKARADYPETGQWLMRNTTFQDWFNPQYPAIPPLLWINGIPGAGKTILASVVVDEARRLKPTPRVLFFYCKHKDSERDNFAALGRSLLSQLLKQDDGLLPTFYQKSCRSGESVLTSEPLIEELLNLAFGNCKSAYIIIDGLDECPRDQRKYITQWFRRLVEDLPNDEPQRLRCVFISQDDGIARKDLAGLASIKIEAENNRRDIEEYSRIEAQKLKQSCPMLTQEKASRIASGVVHAAGGLFLLAKLIWFNLSNGISIAKLDEALEPGGFPTSINEAYHRIMERIAADAPEGTMEDVLRLLSWLVCAKRPLKWHEIQGMKSTNLDEQCVALERHGFIKSPKDLCASLVGTREDGTLEFVHLTVKFFLIDEKHVDASAEELKLATFCIDYLNLPHCIGPPAKEQVLNGDYSFLDYAVIHWLQHWEAGVTLDTHKHQELMEQLAESLGVFIERHWATPSSAVPLGKRLIDKLQFFKPFSFYDQLEKVIGSARLQMNSFGTIKKEKIALDLVSVVGNVRAILERIVIDEEDPSVQQTIRERYGDNVFKCPRFSCKFFTQGFHSLAEREKHVSKHQRPFRCPEETCHGYTWGFASEADRKKHMDKNHITTSIKDAEFPTPQEAELSIIASGMENGQDPYSEPESRDENEAESQHSEPETDSEPQVPQRPQQKKQRQTEFTCDHCQKVFRKRYNLTSHLLTHGSARPHVCSTCGKSFSRKSDFQRHVDTHGEGKRFDCPGCGRSFGRRDILNKHYESRVGRECIKVRPDMEVID